MRSRLLKRKEMSKMPWFNEKGDMQDVVLSTRVRLARNLNEYPFAAHLNDKGADEIIDKVSAALPEYSCEKFFDTDNVKCISYMEMHYVSPEFASSNKHRALLTGENEHVKIMVCEEDHIRIQSIVAGFDPQSACEYAARVSDKLGSSLDIAFSEKYGYLTHCPTNLGAAMRVSAMLCLPALSKTRAFESYVSAASKMGITVRGIYGEGSKAQGNLYQISNRASLGVSEADIIKLICEVVGKLVEAERDARNKIFTADGRRITDKVARSLGVLKNAYMLSSSELNDAFGAIKLGAALGVLENISAERLTEMLIAVQRATLSMVKQGLENDSDRDVARAELVRGMLSDVKICYGKA
jgi:protein arginine kinase